MTEELKEQIVRGMEAYLEAHKADGMSQRKVADICGFSPAIVTQLLAQRWNSLPAGDGSSRKMGEQIFLKIQHGLGLTLDVFQTENYMAVYNTCMDAKKLHQWRIIDGLSGYGKSFSVEQFARNNPRETFLVRGKRNMNGKEFLQTIAAAVGASELGTPLIILRAITDRLLSMSFPLLIIDEAETLFKRNSEGGFSGLKDLCDELKGRVGIVLVGANEFEHELRVRASRLRSCFPQIFRRFKSNVVRLVSMTRDDVAYIAPAFGVTERKEINSLFDTCENFGDLFETLRAVQADQALLTANAA